MTLTECEKCGFQDIRLPATECPMCDYGQMMEVDNAEYGK